MPFIPAVPVLPTIFPNASDSLGIQDRIQVIGNDLFTESRQALSDGILRGVIDKKISKQSALAVKTLFDYLLKKDYPRSSCLVMEPEIVLRSNFQSHSDLQNKRTDYKKRLFPRQMTAQEITVFSYFIFLSFYTYRSVST